MTVMVTMHFWIAISSKNIQPILREKVEIAVEALKERKEKYAGVDNIPAEYV